MRSSILALSRLRATSKPLSGSSFNERSDREIAEDWVAELAAGIELVVVFGVRPSWCCV